VNLHDVDELARAGRLYPSLIIHGGSADARLDGAERLAAILVCEAEAATRPCGGCRHCRRVLVRESEAGDAFHPDVRTLARDLKTATSVDAARSFLRLAQQTPFEARGQVFVIAEANTLSGEAANALLKVLEEPPLGAPRNFMLLAPTREDLLPTLRSRSWSIYLGPTRRVEAEVVAELADRLAPILEGYRRTGSASWLFGFAETLERSGSWDDPRAEAPWAVASASVTELARRDPAGRGRGDLLALAEALLGAPRLRLRSIRPGRILEGLVAGALTGHGAACSALVRRL